MYIMFRTIVLAILFVELGLPLIFGIVGYLFEEDSIGCRIFAVVIILLIAILV